MPGRDRDQIDRINRIWEIKEGNTYRINNIRTVPHDWKEAVATLPPNSLLVIDRIVVKNNTSVVIFHITNTDHYEEEIPLDSFRANIGLGVLSRVE